MKKDFKERYGPWALVVGCVEGMGAAYVERFAGQGLNVALLDRQLKPLKAQAAAVRREHGVKTRVLACDLAEPEQVAAMLDRLDGLEVGMVVCNAALGVSGHWHAVTQADKQRMINVNCVATTMILDRLTRPMAERGRGGVILMSSLASRQGAARQATYAACKSFDLILGESLWDELREQGIDVLTLIAPMVRTPAFQREAADMRSPPFLRIMEPAEVVDEALASLGKEPSVVAGREWRAASFVMQHLLPRKLLISAMGMQMKQRFPGA